MSFSDVEIIELPITVGDGPSVGVPLTVDWEAQSRNVFPLEFFEEFRPKRRNKDHLRIKPETREKAYVLQNNDAAKVATTIGVILLVCFTSQLSMPPFYLAIADFSGMASRRTKSWKERKRPKFYGKSAWTR